MARPSPRKIAKPRISVNELANFMVSTETARMSIIERARNPIRPPIIRYRDARQAICSFLTDKSRSLHYLVDAEQMFLQRSNDAAESALRQEDARLSISVLHAIQSMQNELAPLAFVPAPRNQRKLILSGVEVSVQLDMLIHGRTRGAEQIGAAVLRMTKDDGATASARDRRKRMGLYAAALIRRHVEENISSDRQPANKLCMSIDVQRGELFRAPPSVARRMRDLEYACRVIAALWPQM